MHRPSVINPVANFKNPEGQLGRWLEELPEYTFEIEHRPGCKHNNADSLLSS